ncbi:MAG: metallophosphoesterase [Bacteroidales bacterium]|nr:metallophosphoesterase [Bacteroidales bacterium]
MKKSSFSKFAVILSISLFLITSCRNEKPGSENSSENTFSFAFLTDIHLQPEKNAVEGFQQAIDTLNKLKPDFVITGGDLIMDALAQTEGRADTLYNLYLEAIKEIDMPIYNTIGNHELFGIYEKSGIDPSHELYGDKMFINRIGEKHYAFNHKGWRFYILDAIDETEERTYYGHIDQEQMDWLKQDLNSVDKNTPIVISVHIPFITVQTQLLQGSLAPNGPGGVITNSQEVLELFNDHNLKLVLQGHLHFLEDIYAQGIHFITGGAVSAAWWNGPRNGMEEGFLLVKISDDELTWDYIDFGWEVAE